MKRTWWGRIVVVVISLLGGLLAGEHRAGACGCFTPPIHTVDIVQAAERILFSVDGNVVTMHVQILYSGSAQDFGWIVPVPTVPTVGVSSDELFSGLLQTTSPVYDLRYVFPNHSCSAGGAGGGGISISDGGGFGGSSADIAPPFNPLVVQDSVGPYDYAVLKAENSSALFNWLANNNYAIPTGTMAAVSSYLNPNTYFLALRLHAGQSSGDIQPIVLSYTADMPMIPITATSVTAIPDMEVSVWLLGKARAVSTDYYNTVLDDAALDWQKIQTKGNTVYHDLVARATREAPNRHTFITEYAGPSSVMKGVLDPPGRVDDAAALANFTDPVAFIGFLRQRGYTFAGSLIAVLQKYIPMPSSLRATVTAPTYYLNLAYYTSIGNGPAYGNASYPNDGGIILSFDAVAASAELDAKVIQPTLQAAALFTAHPYLTKLFTTLSPADMDLDPVFGENPTLPDVSNLHQATMVYTCGVGCSGFDGALTTEEGFVQRTTCGGTLDLSSLLGSRTIAIEKLTGASMILTDNSAAIQASLGVAVSLHDAGVSDNPSPGSGPDGGAAASSNPPRGGCSVVGGGEGAGVPRAVLWVLALGLLGLIGRRVIRDGKKQAIDVVRGTDRRSVS